MTTIYGPDINSAHGSGSILNAVWAAGERFVGIKAGGGNVGLYVAPHYVEQVTLARKLGFKILHYFPSGNQPISVQAKFAVATVKPYWRDGDAIGWDNEALDSTGQIRNDHDSALWTNTVRGTGGLNCPAAAVWHYGSSGSTFRDHGPWPLVKATGCTIWAAAYPGPPDMTGTGLTYGVHQYTSAYLYPGSSVNTDRSKTTQALSAIFPKRPIPKPPSSVLAKTTTSITGGPGGMPSNCWKRLQLFAARYGGYRGPLDGALGIYSWEGVQAGLKKLGFYRGTVDGDPAQLTFAALQAWAGVSHPSMVTKWTSITRTEWRAIGKKLNTL